MNTAEENIIRQALDKLQHSTGVSAEWKPFLHHDDKGIDGRLILDLQDIKINFNAKIKNEIRNYQLIKLFELANRNEPFMVIANRIFPDIKRQLRENGIAYLDGAGNLFVNHEGQMVWIDGNKLSAEEKRLPNRAFSKTGLKVLFYLLNDPRRLNLTYRDIADGAGVALGNINLVLSGLKESGFLFQLDKKSIAFQHEMELLNRWISGYRETLKPALYMGNFRMPKNVTDWKNLQLPNGTIWGGEPAADILTNNLNPEILTIYTQQPKSELIKTLKLAPDPNGNIQVHQKFWNNGTSEMQIAPTVLIYTDLVLTNDPRCIEIAESIKREHLQYLTRQ